MSELRHLGERHLNNKTVGETCWCLERKWFHSGGPTKDAVNIVQELQTANSRNANFLLNVGPDKQGKIHPDSIEILAEIGTLLAQQETGDQTLNTLVSSVATSTASAQGAHMDSRARRQSC